MIMEKESKPAMQRKAGCEMEVGEDATLIYSLYIAFAPDAAAGNHGRYRNRRKVE
jgi:hypothetical protein